MSDKKITIGIETTANTSGAVKAVAAIDGVADKAQELDAALDQLGGANSGLPEVAAQAKKAAAGVKGVSTETARLGKRGDGGAAVLEFSRAFEDAQYGIRGVLNNLPGLVMALGGTGGLAGVISVLAVAGSVLWETLGKGAKDAGKDATDFLEIYKSLANEFGNTQLEIEKARETNADANLAKQRGYEENNARIAKTELEQEKKKLSGDSAVALAQARLDLTRQETELQTLSGEKALKLAKQIEETKIRIIQIERQSLELQRQAEERAAAAKVRAAQGSLDNASESTERARQRASGKASDLATANDSLSDTKLERLRTAETLAALKADAEKGKAASNNPVEIALFTSLIKDLAAQLENALEKPSESEANATVRQEAAAETSKQAAENFQKAAEDQAAAAEKLKLAAEEFNNLKATQEQDRKTEGNLNRITDAGAADQKAEDNKTEIVGQLNQLVEGIGESGGKDLAPFITEMKGILVDKALSADELARLPVLMAQYFSKIANVGALQNQAIREAMSRVSDLERETRAIKAAANQRPK